MPSKRNAYASSLPRRRNLSTLLLPTTTFQYRRGSLQIQPEAGRLADRGRARVCKDVAGAAAHL